MTDLRRQERNQAKLSECHSVFADRLLTVVTVLETAGWRPRIQEAWRSPAAQRAAWLAGTSRLQFGFHNLSDADDRPEALAADVLDDGRPLSPPKEYLIALAHAAGAQQLTTGITWGLPQTLRAALAAAIADGDVTYAGKIGWDPTHVQVVDVRLADARRGTRPEAHA